MLFDKTIFIQTAVANGRFFLHTKMELRVMKSNPIIYFVKRIKYFSIYTYLYVKILIFTFLKRYVLSFSIHKEFNDAKFRN